jgi:hypothetical protein
MVTSLTDEGAAAQGNALARLLDGGQLRVYAGTVPSSVRAALGAATLLSTLTLNNPCAPVTTNNIITFYAISPANAVATATATFYRLCKSDGTPVAQDTAGGPGSGAALIFDSADIQSGATVSVSSLSHTVTN